MSVTGVMQRKREVLDLTKIHIGDMFTFRFTDDYWHEHVGRRVQISDISEDHGIVKIEYIYYDIDTMFCRIGSCYADHIADGSILVYSIDDLNFRKQLSVTTCVETIMFDPEYFRVGDPVHVKVCSPKVMEFYGFVDYVDTNPQHPAPHITIRHVNQDVRTRDQHHVTANITPEDYVNGIVEIRKL